MAWACLIEPPELDPETIAICLDALFRIDLLYLKRHPKTPHPYRAGVRYQREPKGQERWASIPKVIERGQGDCEDLACWLTAWYVSSGVDPLARVTFTHRDTPHGSLYHILCLRGSGVVEDPSKRLGMGGPGDRPR